MTNLVRTGRKGKPASRASHTYVYESHSSTITDPYIISFQYYSLADLTNSLRPALPLRLTVVVHTRRSVCVRACPLHVAQGGRKLAKTLLFHLQLKKVQMHGIRLGFMINNNGSVQSSSVCMHKLAVTLCFLIRRTYYNSLSRCAHSLLLSLRDLYCT